MHRICIHTKEVQIITGKSERTARTVINDIKITYNKQKHQEITIREFCDYMGFPYEEVYQMINPNRS